MSTLAAAPESAADRAHRVTRPGRDGSCAGGSMLSENALVRTSTSADAHERVAARHALGSSGVQAASCRGLQALCARLGALVDAKCALRLA